MSINFPGSPSIGLQYTFGNKTWEWTGDKWNFITSFEGPQGIQGIQGITGEQGIQGITGEQGIQGITGAGTQGTTGEQGIQGIQGITGEQGVQGIQGAGSDGAQGIQGITGSAGTVTETSNTAPGSPVDGQMWFDTTDSTLNVYYDDGSTQQWVTTSGPAGPAGATGSQGVQGISGAQGVQGISGAQGVQGITGTGDSTQLQAVNDTSTNADFFPVFVANVGSVQTVTASNTKLYFNPSTGDLSATAFNSLSDVTAKENFESISDSFSILDKIDTYKFNWKDTKELSYGVIAQELEKLMPELVKENDRGQKTVSYIPLIAIMIDAIKKLNDKIESKM